MCELNFFFFKIEHGYYAALEVSQFLILFLVNNYYSVREYQSCKMVFFATVYPVGITEAINSLKWLIMPLNGKLCQNNLKFWKKD